MKSEPILLLFLFLSIYIESCSSAILQEGVVSEHIINGQSTRLTFQNLLANAIKDEFEIDGKTYLFQPVWAFIGLQAANKIKSYSWDLQADCKCGQMTCGTKKCPGAMNSTCFLKAGSRANVLGVSFCVVTDADWCYSVIKDGGKEHTTYLLSEQKVIALSEFGGPGIPFQAPGFTISSSIGNHQYAYNAVITGYKVKDSINLANFRYVENYGLLTVDALKKFEDVPEVIPDWDKSSCGILNKFGFYSQVKLYHKMKEVNLTMDLFTSFHYYSILRKGKQDVLNTLEGLTILGANTTVQWYPHLNEIIYLDPCQAKILQLLKREGKYFVIPPIGVHVSPQTPFCVAIQDNAQPNDLVLYETFNGSSQWKVSGGFTGLLSRDFLEFVDVKLTTKSDLVFSAKDGKIDVFITQTEGDEQPTIHLHTETPLKCEIHLSKNYTIILETKESLKASQRIPKEAGYLHTRGDYSCQGQIGDFIIPSVLSQVPLSKLFVETLVSKVSNETRNDLLNFLPDADGSLSGMFKKAWNDLVGVWNGVMDALPGFVKVILIIGVVYLGFMYGPAFFAVLCELTMGLCGFFSSGTDLIFSGFSQFGSLSHQTEEVKKAPKKTKQVKKKKKQKKLTKEEDDEEGNEQGSSDEDKKKKKKTKKSSMKKKVTYGQFNDEGGSDSDEE